MYYLIYAAENMYGGLHGMYDYTIEWCDTEDEAQEIANEISLEVMNSYACIMDNIYDEVFGDSDAVLMTEEQENYLDELMQENIYTEVYPLPDVDNALADELRELDWDELAERYAR